MKTLERMTLTWVTRSLVCVLALSLLGCASSLQRPKEPLRVRQEKALAMFAERCKRAGEFIRRTVNNVEVLYVLKVRREEANFGDQFALNDPYGRDFVGDDYFTGFLRGSFQTGFTSVANTPSFPVGYKFVDVIDPADNIRYRHTGSIDVQERVSTANGQPFTTRRFITNRVMAPEPPSRYGLTYDDISTREEREYWIAGSSLKVVDLMTDEVIAERIGYMVDVYQGSTAAGRSPWLFAADHACPAFASEAARSGAGMSAQLRQTQRFVEKVLKPSKP